MTLAERAKDLFELGFDTQDISEIIKVSEARIYNALSAIRKERYAVKVKNAESGKKFRAYKD